MQFFKKLKISNHRSILSFILTLMVPLLSIVSVLVFSSNVYSESNNVSNATWLNHSWLEEYNLKRIEILAKDIRDLNITTIYPSLTKGSKKVIAGADKKGWVKNLSNGRKFISKIKELIPGIQVIPYKGLRKCPPWKRVEWDRLADALYWSMDALGADGIQFDYECGNFVEKSEIKIFTHFLKGLKERCGSKTLSIAIPIITERKKYFKSHDNLLKAPWFKSLTGTSKPRYNGMQPHIYEIIFTHADQVVTMMYDTWLTEEQIKHYENLVMNQTWVGMWFAQRFGKDFIPGIRFSVTDSNKKGSHYHKVENPATALEGFKMVLNSPLEEGKMVRDHLSGVVFFRIDIKYESHYKKNIETGNKYWASAKSLSSIIENNK